MSSLPGRSQKKPKKGRLKGAKIPKKSRLKYDAKKSITPQAKQTVKRMSVLEVDKYAPDESSKWRRVDARFPALYKTLLVEPDAATRGARLRQAVSAVG